MIGFSLYFDMDFDLENEISKYEGFDILFTSIHYPKDDKCFEKFLRLYDKAKDFGLRLCVDLNKEVLYQNPALFDMDLILRLDYGFAAEEIALLSKDNRISINASTIDRDFLYEILSKGACKDNILAIHNYYPLSFTGLGPSYFRKRNDLFTSLGIKVAAFVPGNINLRGPIYKSLPTLEEQRLKNPYLSFVELKRLYDLDFIIIAEGLEKKDLANIRNFEKNGQVSLKVELDEAYKNIFGFRQRADISPYILRNERKYKKIKADSPSYIKRGQILICNEKAGRYSGELEICKKDMGLVEDRNVIGKVEAYNLEIIDYIRGGDELVFDRG